jgi:catechol 2,3-dioxygenase-like lactoylglutathione lyase family enzyme
MLGDKEATATVAVKDLDRAKHFYEDTLGLEPIAHEGEEAIVYRAGDSKLLVYRSQYAGTNKATAAGFVVGDDMDAEVRALKEKGVRFEHYDLPGLTLQGDVHVAGDMKAAWFKDPDGNILSMTSR